MSFSTPCFLRHKLLLSKKNAPFSPPMSTLKAEGILPILRNKQEQKKIGDRGKFQINGEEMDKTIPFDNKRRKEKQFSILLAISGSIHTYKLLVDIGKYILP